MESRVRQGGNSAISSREDSVGYGWTSPVLTANVEYASKALVRFAQNTERPGGESTLNFFGEVGSWSSR